MRETTVQPLSSPSLFSSMIDGGNMPWDETIMKPFLFVFGLNILQAYRLTQTREDKKRIIKKYYFPTKLEYCMCRHSLFGITPQRFPSLVPLFFPTSLDRTHERWYHELHFYAKIDGNGPILMELWLGKVWCCDSVCQSQNSPGPSSINIRPFSTFNTYKCR